MTSEVSICNRALTMLGDALIIALTDDNKRARTLNSMYEAVRDAEYDRHRWRFTFARASLPALADAPPFDFALQYQLPSDFIRLIRGGDILSVPDHNDYRTGGTAIGIPGLSTISGGGTGEQWSIEGGMILTNLSAPLHIRYISRVVDTAKMPPSFAEALAARLAFETCETLTQSDAKKQLCWQFYRNYLMEAVRAKALETSPQAFADDTWVTARIMR